MTVRRLGPLALAIALACCAPALAAAPELHVKGSKLVTGSGRALRLLGVNRSGAEFACVESGHLWDGPVGRRSIAAMTAWRINAVRVPLNEDCWLGVNGVATAASGKRYRRAVRGFVRRLHDAGLVVLLDLHWNAPGHRRAVGQQKMPDRSHSPAFWTSVARAFHGDRSVAFDLYNEPHDVSWRCWRDGCRVDGWRAAGMQRLVDAVRSTGARQPLVVGGLGWSGDLSGWWAHRPTDPRHALVAGFHLYNFSACADAACWSRVIAPLAGRVPVLTGELGEDDCGHGFVDRYMDWADQHGISYLGWTWNAWDCRQGPALIASYDGTPTEFGRGLRDHLRDIAR